MGNDRKETMFQDKGDQEQKGATDTLSNGQWASMEGLRLSKHSIVK